MQKNGIIPIDVSGAEPWINSFEEGEEIVYRVEPGGLRTKVGIVIDHDGDGAPTVRKEQCRTSSSPPPRPCTAPKKPNARC